MKQSYERFIKVADMNKITQHYPRIAKGLQSLNPWIQDFAIEDLVLKAPSIDKIDKIRVLAPLAESSDSMVSTSATGYIEELVNDIVMKRRDVRFPNRVVIKPRGPLDPDLSPLAWTVLQLLKRGDDVVGPNLHRINAVKLIGPLQLKEFEPELKEMVKNPALGAEPYAREALELLGLNVPQQ